MSALTVRLKQSAPIPLNAAFSCEAGRLLGVIGPSGGGKSTILRAISGLVTPGQGYIACDGETWLDTGRAINLPPHRRAAGIVFQSYALFPHMTALENTAAALPRDLDRDARRRQAEALLVRVHLGGLGERRPYELSGGQQQRVAVARALARRPKVLLLDEPFSAVDEITRKKLHRELQLLRRDLAIPIVLVTHNIDEAELLADELCLIHRGDCLQSGPVFDVLHRPVSADVARLTGQHNLFPGEIAGHRPETGHSLIRWAGRTLETAHNPAFRTGEKIIWLIPATQVILHQRMRPSRGEKENPADAIVTEYMRIGEMVNVTLAIGGEGNPFVMRLSPRVAERNELAIGQTIRVSLRAEAIHVMAE